MRLWQLLIVRTIEAVISVSIILGFIALMVVVVVTILRWLGVL